jgi:hypothetical protein
MTLKVIGNALSCSSVAKISLMNVDLSLSLGRQQRALVMILHIYQIHYNGINLHLSQEYESVHLCWQ